MYEQVLFIDFPDAFRDEERTDVDVWNLKNYQEKHSDLNVSK
jgi:hypothetical protein